ncbi:hypothetical protein BDN72DRAFT_885999 [Pluteus cervinus]|uniref:Uncharacterized protein n=1 Tax=Pluteus cervinus TaxID=181527 RepID=A0ACD3BC61_9AGAR|nr:hypothetical protein BDN72DRAFT_885999 [Pluteus cervinus]
MADFSLKQDYIMPILSRCKHFSKKLTSSTTTSSLSPIAQQTTEYPSSQFSSTACEPLDPSTIILPVYRNDSSTDYPQPSFPSRFRRPEVALSTAFKGWRLIVLGSWLNILLAFIPITGILTSVKPGERGFIFTFCILSMIPLVKLHDIATRDLAIRIGGSKTGLLNASMSNIVSMVVAISALRNCQLRVVQSSLIGSMLSKLLLVLGLCFFAGGLRFTEQGFDVAATQLHSSLLSISVGAVLLPAAYHFALSGSSNTLPVRQLHDILHMSHGVSLVLLLIYAAYLLFQLWSHTHLYKDSDTKSNRLSLRVPDTPRIFRQDSRFTLRKEKGILDSPTPSSTCRLPRPLHLSLNPSIWSCETTSARSELMLEKPVFSPNFEQTIRSVTRESLLSDQVEQATNSTEPHGCNSIPLTPAVSATSGTVFSGPPESNQLATSMKEPQFAWPLTILSMITLTVAVAVTADWMVTSMDGISHTISKEWASLILLPAVSALAECTTAVNVSVKDQLSLSISVAVGSTIQTALFVIPSMVILAWTMGHPLSLLMDPFESLVLYISVQTMAYVVADGKSNWLEGLILICLYIIIAVSFWFYPQNELPDLLATCSV